MSTFEERVTPLLKKLIDLDSVTGDTRRVILEIKQVMEEDELNADIIKALKKHAQLSESGANTVLEKLKEDGFVITKTNADDKRKRPPGTGDPCNSCGMSDRECWRRCKQNGRPCCGACHMTSTHG